MDRIRAMEVFLQLAESGGVRRAAGALRLSPAMVSTYLTHTEKLLGVSLLQRAASGLVLTGEGQAYLDHCRRVLDDIAETEALLGGGASAVRGRLRVDMPTTIANCLVIPLLPAFVARFPDITLDLSFSPRAFDPTDDGFDVAVRLGPVADIDLIARPLGRSLAATVAAPGYLEERGEPRSIEALCGHSVINVVSSRTGRIVPWLFNRDGQEIAQAIPSKLLFSEGEPRIQAAIHGLGLVQAPAFQVAGLIASGRLRPVLTEFQTAIPPILLLYSTRRKSQPKLRAFVDFLLDAYPPDRDIMVGG